MVALSALCSVARRDIAVMRVSDATVPLLCTTTHRDVRVVMLSAIWFQNTENNNTHMRGFTYPHLLLTARRYELSDVHCMHIMHDSNNGELDDHLLDERLQQALHGQKLCIRHVSIQDLGGPVADTPMMSMA